MIDNFLSKLLSQRSTSMLLGLFFVLRILSFSLRHEYGVQNILFIALLVLFIPLYFYKREWAFRIVAGEILLGGSGMLFEVFGISIRTLLSILYLSLYLSECIFKKERQQYLSLPKIPLIFFGILATIVMYAGIRGTFLGNSTRFVVQDAIPFILLGVIFPLREYLKNEREKIFLLQLVLVYIIGSLVFSLFTFTLFTTGSEVIQGPYYKWFRDIIGGKITDMGLGFFRIVTPEHLLIVPSILAIAAIAKKKITSLFWFLLASSSIILMLNFSRAYLLGLVVGLFILKYKSTWKEWFKISFVTGGLCLMSLVILSFLASRGTSFGFELLGLRTASFIRPQSEESTYTRTELLSPIWEKIKTHPVLGSGIGSQITFVSPITKEEVTTRQFDWGYLEIWAEMGIFGLVAYITLLFALSFNFIRKLKQTDSDNTLSLGLLAGLGSLTLIAIFSPALFHPFGILFLIFVAETANT